ncbi:hypothetical protein R5H30_19775 [Sulfitobacter sp. D35]|uniref:hypothetical protein n=1 Tax=Sulfitobacter sp. D35 TaxID=3083252 RepID=UPI00296FBB41|nr:hypothetical protein [Sulfitobacter sp. D35]MDW4500236.1 hypothetical protein [Sulfitobacter sp. D35]
MLIKWLAEALSGNHSDATRGLGEAKWEEIDLNIRLARQGGQGGDEDHFGGNIVRDATAHRVLDFNRNEVPQFARELCEVHQRFKVRRKLNE